MAEPPLNSMTTVELVPTGQEKPIQSRPAAWQHRAEVSEASFDATALAPGKYVLRAFVNDAAGRRLASATETFIWPERPSLPGAPAGARTLNNMVTDLLNAAELRLGNAPLTFVNPQDSWIFFGCAAEKQKTLSLLMTTERGEELPLVLQEQPDGEALEAMHFLRAGTYRLRLAPAETAMLKGLVVRAVPELAYCFLPSQPRVRAFGNYDQPFLAKDVLPNVNCLVSEGYDTFPKTAEFQDFRRQWHQAGRKWIVRQGGIPRRSDPDTGKPLTVESAFQYCAANEGWKDALVDGIIADEFGNGDDEGLLVWKDAINRLHQTFPGKTFYPWCIDLCSGEPGRALVRDLMKDGDRFAREVYLKEQPTETAAWLFLDRELVQHMRQWREIAGVERNLMICFGHLLSAPDETVNVDPAVDFKVYMDMQFNLLANHPAFWNLGGVMEYHSSFADEEYIRWAGRLYRHYCIEGRTDMLSAQYGYAYHPGCVQNADFDRGAEGWTLSPVEPGSIATNRSPGLGWMEGRYPKGSEGDNFLVTRRTAGKLNVFSQELTNLQPGRLYSLKMFTADYDDLTAGKSEAKKLAVSVRIQDVELVPQKCFQYVFPHYPDHHTAPFTNTHRFYMNFHRVVFRPKSKTARLSISDWQDETTPGGAIGEQILYNFIEVQPYLPD